MSTYFIGDSIAEGFRGQGAGITKVGGSPEYILRVLQQNLKTDPNFFRGKNISLSTGVSNNPHDFQSIEKQLQLLKNNGAFVDVIGASNERYAKENSELSRLSKLYGLNFLGGFTPGSDGVHPSRYDYAAYAGQSLNNNNVPTSLSTPISMIDDSASVNVLAKLDGVQGVLNKTTQQFVPQSWSQEEADRYERYFNASKSAKSYQDNQSN